ncbi:uncharacterized protein LOC144157767 [Haemaphysalis longicornis]
MHFSYCITALLVVMAHGGLTKGAEGALIELLRKLVSETITDPAVKELTMTKLPEMEACIVGLNKMTPEIAVPVLEHMIPAFNTCGIKVFAASDDQKEKVYVSCIGEAAAEVEASTGMSAQDAECLYAVDDCMKNAIGF